MSVIVIPAIQAQIARFESASAPLDEAAFAATLDALVSDPKALTIDERRGCLAEIVGHRFITMGGSDGGPWGIYFGPNSTAITKEGKEIHLPDARSMDAEVIEYWKVRAGQSPHPVLRARYADLAWEIGRLWNHDHPDEKRIELPRSLAQLAIESHLEAEAKALTTDAHQAWQFLGRALELALLIQDQDLVDRSKVAAFAHYRGSVAKGDAGLWWKLDDLMWDRKKLMLSDADRDELVGWLEAALAIHSDIGDPQRFDPHQSLEAADRLGRWRSKMGTPDLGVAALKTAGAAFEAIAAKANALTAIAWLENMSVRYRGAKLMDDATRVDATIFARGDEAKQAMQRHEVQFEIPARELENWLGGLTAGSLELSLARIAVNLMTSEDAYRKLVEEAAANSPMQAHIPIAVMGARGFTVATIGSVKDDMPGRILSQAATAIGAGAPFLHQALERAKSTWKIDSDRWVAFLAQSPIFPPHSHALLKEGIDAWLAQDALKAVHVLVPQVEAALREMLVAMGESPMRPSRSGGGFVTLGMGEVLNTTSFKIKANPTLRLHLRALYTEAKGINLRNKLAHGLAGPELFGRGMANWVVHSLLAVRTFAHLEK